MPSHICIKCFMKDYRKHPLIPKTDPTELATQTFLHIFQVDQHRPLLSYLFHLRKQNPVVVQLFSDTDAELLQQSVHRQAIPLLALDIQHDPARIHH